MEFFFVALAIIFVISLLGLDSRVQVSVFHSDAEKVFHVLCIEVKSSVNDKDLHDAVQKLAKFVDSHPWWFSTTALRKNLNLVSKVPPSSWNDSHRYVLNQILTFVTEYCSLAQK